MNFDVNAFLAILPQALLGWAGVFLVTFVIILVIWVLNRVTGRKQEDGSGEKEGPPFSCPPPGVFPAGGSPSRGACRGTARFRLPFPRSRSTRWGRNSHL